jgi:hypothetical protein
VKVIGSETAYTPQKLLLAELKVKSGTPNSKKVMGSSGN